MSSKYFVTGIGSAIIDVLALVEDDFLENNRLVKGSMTLLEQKGVSKLVNLKYDKISSGGSVANTIVAISNFGIKNSFIGSVGSGHYGDMFQEELEANDVDFHCNFKTKFGSTARSFILITPDSERTMCTYLGEAANVTNEIDGTIIANSDILYIEGYLWDKDSTIKALKKAVLVAKENNTKVAFTLSDTFCVKRHKTEMLKLVSQTDILFANEEEINTLTSSEKLSTAKIKHLSVNNPNILIVITRSGKGAVIFEGETGKFLKVPAIETPNIVDATGAGDAFAAGFFYGLNKEYTLEDCAKIGHIFASNVIQKIGGRFEEEEISRITKLL